MACEDADAASGLTGFVTPNEVDAIRSLASKPVRTDEYLGPTRVTVAPGLAQRVLRRAQASAEPASHAVLSSRFA